MKRLDGPRAIAALLVLMSGAVVVLLVMGKWRAAGVTFAAIVAALAMVWVLAIIRQRLRERSAEAQTRAKAKPARF